MYNSTLFLHHGTKIIASVLFSVLMMLNIHMCGVRESRVEICVTCVVRETLTNQRVFQILFILRRRGRFCCECWVQCALNVV